jgi:hypothetical protein
VFLSSGSSATKHIPNTCVSNSHGQYQEGKIIRQRQTEMNPPNPAPVGIDQVVANQMMIIQQMSNVVTELQDQIRQEREEIRQDWLEIRR